MFYTERKSIKTFRGLSSLFVCMSCHVLIFALGCLSRTVTDPGDQNELLPQVSSQMMVFPGEEDVLESRNNPVGPTDHRGTVVDPKTSWFSFVNQAKPSKEQKKCKSRRKNSRLLGLPGPQGPTGPMGPPGPPGAVITKEEILSEFRTIIREAAERRAQLLVQENCPSCAHNITQATQPWLPEVEDLYMMPIVPVAFHCKLESDFRISGKAKIEVANFQTANSNGLFERGRGLDVTTGRFTAPRSAIYQLSANLHIRHKRASSSSENRQGAEGPPKAKENIRLLICINSLCERHASLEFISGFESSSRIFTISVSGLLTLQRGQYASIYVDNSSSQRIYVQAGSDFSGLLMGA
ncbi:Adipolin [Holothuria leucospilota]|uniref:Adipolin n=1 Tax=Holothuria leucospilota TaxID=206669 RepID=A0A9Q0YJP3_HOLLE|nr:Adipolin [Holothuria leucospilota]